MTMLPITSLYAAIFGIILIVITLRVGIVRARTKLSFGDGGDEDMLRRIRSQANFLEHVPITLILMMLTEMGGASNAYLHGLGGLLLLARMTHYLTLNISPMALPRALGMTGTFAANLMGSGWLIYHAFN